jgi:hypothetical protein
MRNSDRWELLILDGRSGRGVIGDVDGDGHEEIVYKDRWHRPATCESGSIPGGIILGGVGITIGDVDGDGRPEPIGGVRNGEGDDQDWTMCWCKPGKGLSEPWETHVIHAQQIGHPHDQLVVDIDGDGQNELLVAGMYCKMPGIYLYKPGADLTQPWRQHVVFQGLIGPDGADGTAAADLTGDGRVEIVSGPYLYVCPPEGPFSGPWTQVHLAVGLREMCKAAVLDITGNGRPDVIIAESEFPDCRVSWFENRVVEEPEHPWIEHALDAGFTYIHSLDTWRGADGAAKIFLAEMNQGGWDEPYNYDARLVVYTSRDGGATWEREIIYQGFGTFQAVVRDVNGDGEMEVFGHPAIVGSGAHIWKKREAPSFPISYRHRFVDRTKPWVATDILAVDVDGDGRQDVVCGGFWYRNPTWERIDIPGIYQVINAYDLDGDGRQELIATKPLEAELSVDAQAEMELPGGYLARFQPMYNKLSGKMVWLKAIDPLGGAWEEHPIGESVAGAGAHGWPHGTCVAPVLPGGRIAFIARSSGPLELYEVPDDPRQPWSRRQFTEAAGGATAMIPCDLTGDGKIELVAEWIWLESLGDGTFRPHEIVERFNKDAAPEGFRGGAFCIADVNGNGRLDVVACEEHAVWQPRSHRVEYGRVTWFENPGNTQQGLWRMHVIDQIRSPHSLAVADLDGDGQVEIVCGEHDPFHPYRSRCRLYVYKKADPQGCAWTRHLVDDRFSSHVGARLIELAPGRTGILSHSWLEYHYVHLWEPY